MVQDNNSINFEIILVLLKSPTHLREIARMLNKSHVTILRKTSQLIRENIIDYKKEGRNKCYFIKKNFTSRQYIYQAERHKFIKLLKIYPELSVILEKVLKKVDDKLIILFGSYAKFSAKKESDIDIYIETDKNNLKSELKEISSKISLKIGHFDNDSLLIKEIIKNHIVLRGTEEFYEKTKFFE